MDGTQLESLDLLSRCALDRPVQGLVQRGPGSLVFRLRKAALLVFHFELKQLILEPFKQELGRTLIRYRVLGGFCYRLLA